MGKGKRKGKGKKSARKPEIEIPLENVKFEESCIPLEYELQPNSLIGDTLIEFLGIGDLLVLCQVSKSLNESLSDNRRTWRRKLVQTSSPKYKKAWEEISPNLSTEHLKKVAKSVHYYKIVDKTNYFHPTCYGIHSKTTEIFEETFKNLVNSLDTTINDMGNLIHWQIHDSDNIENFKVLIRHVAKKFGNQGLLDMYILGIEIAIQKCRVQICQIFIEIFKRGSLVLTNQMHPLMITAKQDSFYMYLELCLSFEDKNPADQLGLTPLHITGKLGNEEFFSFLHDITNGVNTSDIFGYTPLHYAVLEKHYSLTKYILQNSRFEENFLDSPFNIAINQKSLPICYLFLEILKNKNPKDSNGYSALHYSAYRGLPSVFFRILYGEKFEDLTPANDGMTIFHCAMIGQSYPIFSRMIMLIRENQGFEYPMNNAGQTPFDLAVETRHPNLEAIIREFDRDDNIFLPLDETY